MALQARIQLQKEEDAARDKTKRDAKRARAWAAVGVDMAEDSGTREECDIAGRLDPGNMLFEQMKETSTTPWVSSWTRCTRDV